MIFKLVNMGPYNKFWKVSQQALQLCRFYIFGPCDLSFTKWTLTIITTHKSKLPKNPNP